MKVRIAKTPPKRTFADVEPGEVFTPLGTLWLGKSYIRTLRPLIHQDLSCHVTAVNLETGDTNDFPDDQPVRILKGEFVEEGA